MKRGAHHLLLIGLCLFALENESAAAKNDATERDPVPMVTLRGVILRQALNNFDEKGAHSTGIDFSASPVAAADPTLRAKANGMIGQPITIELLQSLSSEVVLAYRRAGRPLADAAVPEQNISNGTVQVIVLEAHLGAVHVEGAKYFSAARMAATVRTQPGDSIVAGSLFSDLDWLNRNPFRRVDLVYERGSVLNTTDVTLRVTDHRPWLVFTGYDNENVDVLGRDRWFLGYRAGNLFEAEQQLNLLYTQGENAHTYQGYALDYTIPLQRRNIVTVSASYARPRVRGTIFDSEGKSWRLGLRYGGELPRTRLWQFDWALGYDGKSNNNDILFGGTQVFSGAYQTHEFVGEFAARRPGPKSETTLKAAIYVSPGNIGGQNSAADLAASGRSDLDPRYAYLDFRAGHKATLAHEFELGLDTRMRLTTDRLPTATQFPLGGAALVPGYAEVTALGDAGAWAQARLQSPVVHLLSETSKSRHDAWRVSAIYSLGRTVNRQRTAAERAGGTFDSRTLESVGLGTDYEYSRSLRLNFTYGWQLRSPATGVGRTSRGHVSAVVNF